MNNTIISSIDDDLIDNIITNLKLVSMLEVGQKLIIRKGHLHIDNNNKIQPLRRWLYSDNRDQTIIFIKNLVRSINTVINKDQGLIPKISKEMCTFELGIKNLNLTYSSDPVIVVILDNILEKIKEMFN